MSEKERRTSRKSLKPSDVSASSLSRSEGDKGVSRSESSSGSKGKLRIWKKVKKLGGGKRYSADAAVATSSATGDEYDDDGEQLDELDHSPNHSHSRLSSEPPESESVRSLSPLPSLTPDSRTSTDPPLLDSSTESAAGRAAGRSSSVGDAYPAETVNGHAALQRKSAGDLSASSSEPVTASAEKENVPDGRSAFAPRVMSTLQPLSKAAVASSSSIHGGELSPVRKRLGFGASMASSVDEAAPSASTSQHGSPPSHGNGFPFLLSFTIVSGHNLASRDSNGLSDPYVKVKVGSGYSKARTTTMYKTLSPIWNECFDLGIYDRDDSVLVRVFDKDIIGSDDSMGRAVINLSKISLECDSEVRLGLESMEGDLSEDMGYLMVRVHLQSVADMEPPKGAAASRRRNVVLDSSTSALKKSKTNSRRSSADLDASGSCLMSSKKCGNVTRSILSVTLLSGTQLSAMDENGLSDPYCKFRLGSEKWKSRVINKSLSPEWKEKFEMRMLDGASDTLTVTVYDKDYASKDDFMGSCEVDISTLAPDVTHNMKKQLVDGDGELNFLLTITGLKDPSEFVGVDPQDPESLRTDQVLKSYCLQKTTADIPDVGILMVKVVKAAGLTAADIGGTSDPFVTVELGNSMVRTETVYKTLNPEWHKCFFLKVKDIHSVLDIVVSDEDRDRSEFLGRLKIPLLSITPGETRWYALKDEKLRSMFKGQIELQFDLIYNPIRASIRTFNPAEKKYIEESDKFSRQILSANITRVASLVRTISAFAEFINSIFLWKHKFQTSLAFLVFIVTVLIFDLWMIFAFLLSVFMVQYFRSDASSSNQVNPYQKSAEDAVSSDEDDEKLQDKKGLRQRLQDLYNICLTVQNALDTVAGLGERIKNTFNWTTPFQSWLAMAVLTIAMIVTYVIPLRFLVLLWGINKFTKRLRKPNFIPNNEVLDFLSRTPSDPELAERCVVTAAVVSPSKHAIKKKKKRQ